MDILVYTKPNCPECTKVKHALEIQGYLYTEKLTQPEDVPMLAQYTRSMPVVFVDGAYVPNQSFFN